jgi:hypothetical protein
LKWRGLLSLSRNAADRASFWLMGNFI